MNATDRQLIDAVNLLAEYAMQHLPADYTITLSLTKSEASLRLEDPDGDEIEIPHDDGSSFRNACDAAVDHEAEWAGDGPED